MKLQTAVIKTITEFAATKTNFSAWNITKSIRDKVNADEWEIWSEKEQDNSKFIPHEAVRSFVHDMYNEGLLEQFGITDKEDNGQYQTFIFDAPDAPEAVEEVDNDVVGVSPNVVVSVVDPAVGDKITTYISKCAVNPSIKQIQSAIKVNGVTCKDIYDFLVDEGYEIEVGGPISMRYLL